MKRGFVLFLMLSVLAAVAWGEIRIISDVTFDEQLEINASGYHTILLRNSKFERSVIITNNEALQVLMILNCNFEETVSIRNNNTLTSLSIANSNYRRHFFITDNIVEKSVLFNNNIIDGFLQFSRNHVGERCVISNSRVERAFSCFGNTFSSMLQLNTSDFNLRSVMYKNRFNEFEINDVNFGSLTMEDNYIEKSIGFTDCTITANFTISRLNDIGDPAGKRSVSFYNTSVFGNIFFNSIDSNVLLVDLWQLDFFNNIFIDYNRLINDIDLITNRIVHSPQSIEKIPVINPFKELSEENLAKFNQFISNIKNSFERRGDRDARINFIKWESNYRNSFNNPFQRFFNLVFFHISFGLFLNITAPIFISLIICILFMFVYIKQEKLDDGRKNYVYLNINDYQDCKTDSQGKRIKNCFIRYFTAFFVSVSVFCNLPFAANNQKEDKAKNITWIQRMLGMIMLLIIAGIIGRIATI